jgi:hypothetical protein
MICGEFPQPRPFQGFLSHGATPIAAWSIFWNILLQKWMITGATPIETSIYRWFTMIYLFQNQNVFFFSIAKLWNYRYVHATFTPRWTIKDGYARLSIRGLGTGSSVRPIWCIHRSSFRNSPNEPRRFCMVFYLRTRRIYSFWCPSYYQIIHIYIWYYIILYIWYQIYMILHMILYTILYIYDIICIYMILYIILYIWYYI